MSDRRANPSAVEAFTLLLRGDLEEGIILYRESLNFDKLYRTPVGVHLLLLERAGRFEAVARLRDLAVEQGANVALKAGGFGAEPGEAVAEYEALFARGIVNSRMVFEYLRVLAGLGRMTELRRMLNPERLLRISRLERSDSTLGNGNLAESVESLLRELEPQSEQVNALQSVRNMRKFSQFSALANPAAQALMTAISTQVKNYLVDWRSSDHPLANAVPQTFRIRSWGLISKGEGYNVRHIHNLGWATGVYYPTAVEPGAGGELMIGRPEGAAGSDADWGTTRVRPEAGLLVLIPSYFTHWTVPLNRPGLRLSVAFDVLPEN